MHEKQRSCILSLTSMEIFNSIRVASVFPKHGDTRHNLTAPYLADARLAAVRSPAVASCRTLSKAEASCTALPRAGFPSGAWNHGGCWPMWPVGACKEAASAAEESVLPAALTSASPATRSDGRSSRCWLAGLLGAACAAELSLNSVLVCPWRCCCSITAAAVAWASADMPLPTRIAAKRLAPVRRKTRGRLCQVLQDAPNITRAAVRSSHGRFSPTDCW